jgi:hypothetical protein
LVLCDTKPVNVGMLTYLAEGALLIISDVAAVQNRSTLELKIAITARSLERPHYGRLSSIQPTRSLSNEFAEI